MNNKSSAVVILVGTQALSFASLLLWTVLFTIYQRFSADLQNNWVFLAYPLLPIVYSAWAWWRFKQQSYRSAVILSAIPAFIAFALMTYYYIQGVSSH
ncbi:MAG: hypothetical protein JNJ85_16450 [Candidatus Kapabacteria bacterium]|nr:hypothetical protein [Candidatus Kapabacteria bacterium]